MKKRLATARGTLIVVAILAGLMMAGHNGTINLLLAASVLTYLGIDLSILHRWRP